MNVLSKFPEFSYTISRAKNKHFIYDVRKHHKQAQLLPIATYHGTTLFFGDGLKRHCKTITDALHFLRDKVLI